MIFKKRQIVLFLLILLSLSFTGLATTRLVKADGGYEPTTLDGSQNKNFPDIGHSILGFTVKTIGDFGENPRIHFSLQEIFNDPYARYLRIYIDEVKIWEIVISPSLNGHYSNVIDAPQLKWKNNELLDTHEILIEIFWGANEDGAYNTPSYKLDYLQLSKIEFEQIEIDGFYDPKALIGSQNRKFADIGHSILGFTIRTTKSYLGEFPEIHFSFQEIFNDPCSRYLRIHVDGTQICETIFSLSLNGHYSNVIAAPQLMWKTPIYFDEYLNVHEVSIEIFWGANEDGQYNTPSYKLEYFQLSKITFEEVEVQTENQVNYYYTPEKSIVYSSPYDGESMTISAYHEAGENGVIPITTPDFRLCCLFSLDDDDPDYYRQLQWWIFTGYEKYTYYVRSCKVQWRILLSDGTYLNYQLMNELLHVKITPGGEYTNTELDFLLEFAEYLPLDYPIDVGLKLIKDWKGHAKVTQGHDTNNDYWVQWTNAETLSQWPEYYNKAGIGMNVKLEADLPSNKAGPLQLEATWTVDVWEYYRYYFPPFTSTVIQDCTYAFTRTFSQTFALTYSPP